MELKELEINFGERVEQLLKERQIKPFDFYNSIGIVPQNFYDWKKKGSNPNAGTALKVAQFFGVTVEYLLTGKTDNPLQPKVDELQKRLLEINEYISKATSLASPVV